MTDFKVILARDYVKEAETTNPVIKTGIAELDNILGGGLTANRVYLLHGTPGSGKTTLSLQFLLEGVRQGEKVLYVTLSETRMPPGARLSRYRVEAAFVAAFQAEAYEI